jgi:hypothetical protein
LNAELDLSRLCAEGGSGSSNQAQTLTLIGCSRDVIDDLAKA